MATLRITAGEGRGPACPQTRVAVGWGIDDVLLVNGTGLPSVEGKDEGVV